VAPPRKVERRSRESETKSEEQIHLRLFFFLPVGLCTVAFPIEADAGGIFSVTMPSLEETSIALPRSPITSDVTLLFSEKMQSTFSSPESKVGGVFSKLIASNLRRAY